MVTAESRFGGLTRGPMPSTSEMVAGSSGITRRFLATSRSSRELVSPLAGRQRKVAGLCWTRSRGVQCLGDYGRMS